MFIQEYMNFATKIPDVFAQMEKKLQKYQATYFNPDCGGPKWSDK